MTDTVRNILHMSRHLADQADAAAAPNLDCLTLPEVAAKLKVSRSTVTRLINDGQLHAFSVGTSRRVRVTELERYLNAVTQTA